jgi:hypothetical protein
MNKCLSSLQNELIYSFHYQIFIGHPASQVSYRFCTEVSSASADVSCLTEAISYQDRLQIGIITHNSTMGVAPK